MVLVFDTDPGVDDMLALLLLLSADPSEAELRMITLTYGNCSLGDTLNNTLSLFNVIDKETKWRQQNNLPKFSSQKPEIYIGSAQALPAQSLHSNGSATQNSGNIAQNLSREEAVMKAGAELEAKNAVDATDVHGSDGLAGIHAARPEFDAPQNWFEYFGSQSRKPSSAEAEALPFVPGLAKPAWMAILDLLREEPPQTVTIIAVGPLTNLARAAELDPKTFLRVKEVYCMGGALRRPGNITPLAEFNVFTDPVAAARLFALTSQHPADMLPAGSPSSLLQPDLPRLRLVLFPLDITHAHALHKSDVDATIGKVRQRYSGSVLADWTYAWLSRSFANYGRLVGRGPENAECHLHDPLTAAYALSSLTKLISREGWVITEEDVRVETSGQWCAGATIVDDRGRARVANNPHDLQKWLTLDEGNRVGVCSETPIKSTFSTLLMQRIVHGLLN